MGTQAVFYIDIHIQSEYSATFGRLGWRQRSLDFAEDTEGGAQVG